VKDTPVEDKSARVGASPMQAGEIYGAYPWAEPRVWTQRMLEALDKGVKGGVWFSLIDKVCAPRTLEAAWEHVRSNGGSGGVDRQTVEQFEVELERRLRELSEDLKTGRYRPQPVRRVYIPKPDGKQRPLGIPTVRDRVVQGALRLVLEPIFEKEFSERSYGFRPGRGAKDALRRVDGLLASGGRYVVDADLKSYFDTIPHEGLMAAVRTRVADGRVLALIEMFLKAGIMEDLREHRPTAGTPQGGVISPLLANIYLHPLDQMMAEAGHEMIRYADDFVVLCTNEGEAQAALEKVRGWVTAAGLELHPEKTRLVDMDQPGGFDFLGYHFEKGRKTPRSKSLEKLKDTIRAKTRRTNGESMQVVVANLNRTLRGWFEYFKHCHWYTFERVDKFIRTRLRSIYRKRCKRKGRGRGLDHQRWPNAHFYDELKLFSLERAFRIALQSRRAH
jgi:RNA-directed DNA polymerase